ncbi:hypothetical protein BDN70DRAFT_551198 [Pholiota conissans]|uniref:C2H2-type domain-containing protein n=1 Tax=Pholiota conissans TaxID=109636 RepID=A0A9P5YKT9_9AGAR|nr:hypothetical protein BDN70DRAFT_551198 [Pholiota conissans]
MGDHINSSSWGRANDLHDGFIDIAEPDSEASLIKLFDINGWHVNQTSANYGYIHSLDPMRPDPRPALNLQIVSLNDFGHFPNSASQSLYQWNNSAVSPSSTYLSPESCLLYSSSSGENSPSSDRAFYTNDDGSPSTVSLYSDNSGLDNSPTSPSNGASYDNREGFSKFGISIDDTIMLLNKMGRSVEHLDHVGIRDEFSMLLSFADTEHLGGAPGLRKPKPKVSSTAGRIASVGRRKNEASFVCELRSCGGSFTRKNGLINHYRSHLGIADRFCQYCHQGFTTSLSRHERNCQRKQTNQPHQFSMKVPVTLPGR